LGLLYSTRYIRYSSNSQIIYRYYFKIYKWSDTAGKHGNDALSTSTYGVENYLKIPELDLLLLYAGILFRA
jgi:hypothetical protein